MSTIKVKTLFDLAKDKGFKTNTELWGYIRNKTLKTVGNNRSGHNYPAKFKAVELHSSYAAYGTGNKNTYLQMRIDKNGSFQASAIYLDELALDAITIKDIEADIAALAKQKESAEAELQICKDLGIEEYDELLVKTIRVLDKIKTTKSKDRVKEAKELLEELAQ